MKRCGICGTGALKRCGRSGVDEYFLSLAGLYPHKCGYCLQKSYALLWVKCVPIMVCLVMVGAGALGGLYALRAHNAAGPERATIKRVRPEARRTTTGHWAAMEGTSVLDNNAVMEMAHTNLSARTLVKAIERSACRFDMSPSAIIRMKSSGVADEVIYAMLSNLDQCDAPVHSAVDSNIQDKLSSAIATELVAPVQ